MMWNLKTYQNSPLLLQLLLFLFGMSLGQLAGGFFLQVFSPGLDLTSLSDMGNMSAAGRMNLRFLQLFHSLITFGIPALITWKVYSGQWLPSFEKTEKSGWAVFGYIPALLFLLLPLMQTMFVLNQNLTLPSGIDSALKGMEGQMNAMIESLLSDRDTVSVVFNVFLMVVVAAVTEELFFRGVLQRLIAQKWGDEHVGIFFSALLFSTVHMQFYGFLPRMALGILFGYLYYRSRRLAVPIVAHAVFNGSQLAAFYAVGTTDTKALEIENTMLPLSMTLFSTLIFLMMYYSFHTYTKKKL